METKISFRLLTSLYNKEYVALASFDNMPFPVVGSIVNINGNPFIVYEVSNVYYDNFPCHAYVYLFKAGSFKLRIGKKNY